MGRALSAILNTPWAMNQDMVQTFIEITERSDAFDGLIPKDEAVALLPMKKKEAALSMRDSIAVITVKGPIFRYASLFEAVCEAGVSVATLSRLYASAMEDPKCEGILFVFDSPGGEVSGISELSDYIFANRATKPTLAYTDALCCSAAYWLGSSCQELYVADTSLIGSIGVVSAYNKSDEPGKVTFVNSKSPNKVLDPESDEGKANIISRIDALADVFYNKVARNRGVTLAEVEKDFGAGGVFVGAEAVARKMVDGVSTFEETFMKLKKRCEMDATMMADAAALQASADEAKAALATVKEQTASEIAALKEELAQAKGAEAAAAKALLATEITGMVGAEHSAKLMEFYGKLNADEIKGMASLLKVEQTAKAAVVETLGAPEGSDAAVPVADEGTYDKRVQALVADGMSAIEAEKTAAAEAFAAHKED